MALSSTSVWCVFSCYVAAGPPLLVPNGRLLMRLMVMSMGGGSRDVRWLPVFPARLAADIAACAVGTTSAADTATTALLVHLVGSLFAAGVTVDACLLALNRTTTLSLAGDGDVCTLGGGCTTVDDRATIGSTFGDGAYTAITNCVTLAVVCCTITIRGNVQC